MKTLLTFCLAISTLSAAVRVNIAIGAGHPILRPRTVIVHRAPFVIGPRVVYAPPLIWRREVVVVPRGERLVWEDREVLSRDEDWVDTLLPVRNSGSAVLLRVDGRAQVDFAEVHFRDGQVQVVDFKEERLERGTYTLFAFAGNRYVENVRLIGRALSSRATMNVLLRK